MILIVYNSFVIIKGATRKELRLIDKITSYKVSGYFFSPAFKAHRWDGKEHLLKYSNKYGYKCPAGMLDDIIALLKKNEIEFKLIFETTKIKKLKNKLNWNNEIKLFPYQKSVLKRATSKNKTRIARGLINLPIRSGKTITSAAIIHKLSTKTLFIVPSLLLLYQTQKSFEKLFSTEIGIIGDANWIEKNVTVATVQTLLESKNRKEKKYYKLLRNCDLLIFDECHHLVSKSWKEIAFDADAPCVLGLSATIELNHDKQNELGVIWLKAICGNIIKKISISKLIKDGYLQQPIVELYKITKPKITIEKWDKSFQNICIYENKKRNKLIAKITKEKIDSGLNCVIITNRLNQLGALSEYLEDMNINFGTITGADDGLKREEIINQFKNREIDAIITTVFKEGVDIPEIECVINAEGGADPKASIQKMRNLTKSKEKNTAIYVDMMDLTNKYFSKNSAERLAVYRKEKMFKIKVKNGI